MKTAAYITVDYDQDADFSWLEQECFQDDPDYCNPANHVALEMTSYDADDNMLDSLGNIDFLLHEDDWMTGTFHRIARLPVDSYLRECARDMGLPE